MQPTVQTSVASEDVIYVQDLVKSAKGSLKAWAAIDAVGSSEWHRAFANIGGHEGAGPLLFLASLDSNGDGIVSAQEVEAFQENAKQLVESCHNFCLNLGLVAALILSIVYPICALSCRPKALIPNLMQQLLMLSDTPALLAFK